MPGIRKVEEMENQRAGTWFLQEKPGVAPDLSL